MTSRAAGDSRPVLLVSGGSGGMTPEVAGRLAAAFPGHRRVELDTGGDVGEQVGGADEVLVAGGDGTVGLVLRALAGSDRRVGLLPVGTFNNFAGALGIPSDLDGAIGVARAGRARRVTLGRVAGRPFLEVAAVGMFGELIVLGEAAKDRAFGELREHLRQLREQEPFRYRLSGDVRGRGRAASLVFANTPTTGAHVPVGDATPDDPELELTLDGGATGSVLARVAAAVLRRPGSGPRRVRVRRVTVHTDEPVPVYADAARVATTPVTIESWPAAVTMIEP